MREAIGKKKCPGVFRQEPDANIRLERMRVSVDVDPADPFPGFLKSLYRGVPGADEIGEIIKRLK